MVARKGRLAVKILGGLVLGLAVLAAAGWIAFVPSAKEPAYAFVKAWGEKGTDPGQLNAPTGIAVANGEVFVADSRNGRIQVRCTRWLPGLCLHIVFRNALLHRQACHGATILSLCRRYR